MSDGNALGRTAASEEAEAPRSTTSSSSSSTSTTSTSTTSTSTSTPAPTTTRVDPPTTAQPPTTSKPRTPRSTTAPAPTTAAPPPAAELPPATAPPPTSPAPAGWHTVFADEFDGNYVDTSKWSVCGSCTTNLDERVDHPSGRGSQAGVSDGSLWIQARGDGDHWTSSPWVWTQKKFTFRHGKVEIRAKMPKGTGVWPALWLLPAQDRWPPEIDIYESIDSEARYYVNYHWGSSNSPRQFHESGSPEPIDGVDTTQWHTYGVEWTPGLLVFTLDGAEVARASQGIDDLDEAAEMYLIMNVALGGDWASEPDGSTPGTSEMRVDWVRVYQQ